MEIRIDETSETQKIKCKEYRTGARHMTMVIKNCVQCGMTAYYVNNDVHKTEYKKYYNIMTFYYNTIQ
jgi:hypothetical protein